LRSREINEQFYRKHQGGGIMRKTAILFIAIILTVMVLSTGCSGKKEPVTSSDNIDNSQEEINNINDGDTTDENEDIVLEGVPSPLSGIYALEEVIEKRPVAIMFDNHPRARWQSGINKAEIVYEFLVEAPYTRYMGIFLINEPELIGPIRSARPYFITTLLEYDPVYVRVGGSEEAKKDVKALKVADIDGLYSGAFWRYTKTGKKEPNNMYTSMEAIRKEQKRLGYKETGNYEGFNFNQKDIDIEGLSANSILIEYNKENTTKYVYDLEQKVYNRYKDGKVHIDEYDNKGVTAKNIIIQEAETKTIDNDGRLAINLIGKGKGKFITNGKVIDITWKKESRQDKTIFSDIDNNEIILNPGITWIQVTKTKPNITIE